jgi:radical SAM protein with 4Fe4S-binding SPASM domain
MDAQQLAEYYSRTDQTKVSQLLAKRDIHEVIGEIVGPEFQEYRRKWDLAQRFELDLQYPLHVDFELTFACNLRCPMCILSLPKEELRDWGDQRAKLTLDTAKRLIDEGVREGQASLGLNNINEPLLTPYLTDVVEYAKRQGMLDIMFNTNGFLLTEELSHRLIESGLTRIMFSLDAMSEETYDKIRVRSDFHRVMNNIETFLRVKREKHAVLPLVRVSFVKMSINEHELDAFIDHWSGRVDFLSIQQYGNPFRGEGKAEKESLRAQDLDFQFEEIFQCPQPWVRATVRNDGTVVPCCAVAGYKIGMGNIHEKSLKEIWTTSQWQQLRALHRSGDYRENSACRECKESRDGEYEEVLAGDGLSAFSGKMGED